MFSFSLKLPELNHYFFLFSSFLEINTETNEKGPRVLKSGIWRRERKYSVPLLQGGHVTEKSLGVSTLQAAEPPYSVNNGAIK